MTRTIFDVKLAEIGGAKLAVIKIVKEKLGVSLAESKALVESCEGGVAVTIKTGCSQDEAEALMKYLNDAGAKSFIG
jgi:large subunit ribosomal protein L7/L12